MDQHDDMLFEMLKECRTLPTFLDHIFGFLKRRTDFYVIQSDSRSNVGLPEGLAESIVRQSYFKYLDENVPVITGDCIPVIGEETVIDECVERLQLNDEVFCASDSYNGAVYGDYCWSQTIGDVDVVVRVPKGVTVRDLRVDITASNISVRLKDGVILLEGELYKKIKHNDVVWALEKRKLQIHVDKCQEMWWDCLIITEPKLDISKIDCSRPYEDLSEEAQAKIEELQWNQDRKRLGLPTSDELQMHEKLKKAWNVEGSPFSGPFDPSKVKLN